MIYLIDDNQNNLRSNLGADFVDEGLFNDYLTAIDKLEKKEKASDVSHLEFLRSAECILMHDTTEDWCEEKGFISGSNTNVRKIKEDVADFGDSIPLVLFSNGWVDTIFEYEKNPNVIRQLNKNLFYERLFDFMEYYKNENKIELRILAWGKNFKANEIADLTQILLEKLVFDDGSDNLLKSVINDEKLVFEKFLNIAGLKDNKTEILQSIENGSVTVAQFQEKTQLIVDSFYKHGKNIYTW